MIGLIFYSPKTLEEWQKQGQDKNEWYAAYTVDFMNNFGYMDHVHLPEIAMTKYNTKLPKKISFLKTLKMHYLGKKKIKSKYFT